MVVYHHWSVEWHPRDNPPTGCRASCVSLAARSPIRGLDLGRFLPTLTARCVSGISSPPAARVTTALGTRLSGVCRLSLTMRMAMRRKARGAMIRCIAPAVGSCVG